MKVKYFNESLEQLKGLWGNFSCKIIDSKLSPMPLAIYHDIIFFSCLEQGDVRIAFLQLCCKPCDFIDNDIDKLRLDYFYQFQVLLSSVVYSDAIQVFKDSFKIMGLNDVDLENQIDCKVPFINAYGSEQKARINGLEVGRCIYIKKMGDVELEKPFVAPVYDMSMIVMILQEKDSMKLVEFDETINMEDHFEKLDHCIDIKKKCIDLCNKIDQALYDLKRLEAEVNIKVTFNIQNLIMKVSFGLISGDFFSNISSIAKAKGEVDAIIVQKMNIFDGMKNNIVNLNGVEFIELYNKIVPTISVLNILCNKNLILQSEKNACILQITNAFCSTAYQYLNKIESHLVAKGRNVVFKTEFI